MKNDCSLCSHLPGCLFGALTPEELCQLASYKHSLRLRRNTIIYVQGVSADGVYFLCRGTIKLVSETAGGEQRIVGFVKAGEMFGLDSLLSRSIRVFTAVTRESCELIYFDRRNFSRVLKSNLKFLWQFAAILNLSLHRSQKSRLLLSGNRVRTRLKNALLQCTSGIRDLRQVELAQLLGVSAETVSREMRNVRESDDVETSESISDREDESSGPELVVRRLAKVDKKLTKVNKTA